MNFKLNYEGFEQYLVDDEPLQYSWLKNARYEFRFENGYGASVIKHKYSYGGEEDLWELAVLKYDKDGNGHICYSTEIADDCIGWLTDEKVRDLLGRIKELK